MIGFSNPPREAKFDVILTYAGVVFFFPAGWPAANTPNSVDYQQSEQFCLLGSLNKLDLQRALKT